MLIKNNIEAPYLFELTNAKSLKKTYVGVREFTAMDGCIHMPYWMMTSLRLCIKDSVLVRSCYAEKATRICVKPVKFEFLLLENYRHILEHSLENYACLTEGDNIEIKHLKEQFTITITQCLPTKVVTIDADTYLEIEEPLEYQKYLNQKELEKNKELPLPNNSKSKSKNFIGNSIIIRGDIELFNPIRNIEVPNLAANPKQKRLKNGIVRQ